MPRVRGCGGNRRQNGTQGWLTRCLGERRRRRIWSGSGPRCGERGNAVEAPAAAKGRNLEARLATADAGRALASGALDERAVLLVALEQELREKAACLARRRGMKSSGTLRPRTWCCGSRRGTRSCGGPSPRTSHFIGVCVLLCLHRC
jgi:hypothetical protein